MERLNGIQTDAAKRIAAAGFAIENSLEVPNKIIQTDTQLRLLVVLDQAYWIDVYVDGSWTIKESVHPLAVSPNHIGDTVDQLIERLNIIKREGTMNKFVAPAVESESDVINIKLQISAKFIEEGRRMSKTQLSALMTLSKDTKISIQEILVTPSMFSFDGVRVDVQFTCGDEYAFTASIHSDGSWGVESATENENWPVSGIEVDELFTLIMAM